MDAEQDQLYYDFRKIASEASGVEIDESDFVRYFNYDSGTLEIEYNYEDGG